MWDWKSGPKIDPATGVRIHPNASCAPWSSDGSVWTSQRTCSCPLNFVPVDSQSNCVQNVGRTRAHPRIQAPARSFSEWASRTGRWATASKCRLWCTVHQKMAWRRKQKTDANACHVWETLVLAFSFKRSNILVGRQRSVKRRKIISIHWIREFQPGQSNPVYSLEEEI